MAIAKDLLDILACPRCKAPVVPVDEGRGLACANCDLVYEVQGDIPVMIVELAKPLSSRDK